jgi:two-component system CheB/CheR fusion protein
MHGGRIDALSEGIGRGARFRLRLPAMPSSPALGYTDVPVDTHILKGLRVLLVDDAADGLEALSKLLKMEGASVRVELSGKAALAAVAEGDFDLILSDIGIPGMSGYTLVVELRKLPRTATVPVIALSSFGQGNDVVDALLAGFDAPLSKPVSLIALLGAIQQNLPRR